MQANDNVPASFAYGLPEILAVLLQFSPKPLLGLVAWRGLLEGLVALGQRSQVHSARAWGPRASPALLARIVLGRWVIVLAL